MCGASMGLIFPRSLRMKWLHFFGFHVPSNTWRLRAAVPEKEVKLEVLGALLPTNAVAALLPVIEHGPVGEGFLQGADSGVPGLQSCLPPCPAAFVPASRRSSLVIIEYSPFVQIQCRVPSNLRCPDT